MHDCEVYVDSEEDEVFFGSVNDREKKISCKLTDNFGFNKKRVDEITGFVIGNNAKNKNVENCLTNVEGKTKESLSSCGFNSSAFSVYSKKEEDSFEDEFHSIHSNNTTVELDHNYSCTKQKIDESILATPKSIVKADKDGGFLKVLSEIALVKAEVDNKLESNKTADDSSPMKINELGEENKENKICTIPEIRIIEATPEKPLHMSPSSQLKSQFKKIKIISSPKQSNFCNDKQKVKSKSFTESQVNFRNSGKKSWMKNASASMSPIKNEFAEEDIIKKSRGNSWPTPIDTCNTSIDLINLNDDSFNGNSIEINKSGFKPNISEEKNKKRGKNETLLVDIESSPLESKGKMSQAVIEKNKNEGFILIDVDTPPKTETEKLDLIMNSNKPDETFEKTVPPNCVTLSDNEKSEVHLNANDSFVTDKISDINFEKQIFEQTEVKSKPDSTPNIKIQKKDIITVLEDGHTYNSYNSYNSQSKITSDDSQGTRRPTSMKFRFSKEAKTIVEALKCISSVNDTLNFTIPEMDSEEVENSFLSSETIFIPDVTIMENKESFGNVATKTREPSSDNVSEKIRAREKEQCKAIVAAPEIASNPLRYFSDKKIQPSATPDVKKCVKKLPIPNRTPFPVKGVQQNEKKFDSKIPAPGFIASKISSRCLLNDKYGPVKFTPCKIGSSSDALNRICKTPGSTGNLPKSSKFKNVASPIGAYIHNKQTARVVNLKSQEVKDRFLVAEKPSSGKMAEIERKSNKKKEFGLQFFEHKSATPFKLEKRPESRLPRLMPNLERLIDYTSPRILKHKGRHYVKTPAKENKGSVDSTIRPDGNEVSILISQVAQKSSSIK